MDRLKNMKETLMNVVQSQLVNPAAADTKELGEAVDMIKDLEEAIYYCSVVEAMEDSKKEKEMYQKMPQQHYYTPYIRYIDPYLEGRDMDWERGKMYYDGRGGNSNGNSSRGNGSSNGIGGRNGYDEYSKYPMEIRDYREGRSPISRRGYMEAKEMHKDKNTQMQELEKYMQELSSDITEMIMDATPEEKSVLQQRLNTLVTKIK